MNTEDLKYLKSEIDAIKERNRRVEADKAWETSRTRTAFIAISSFILIYIVMKLVNADRPFINAIVSTVAYLLSTESYGLLKKWWLKRNK